MSNFLKIQLPGLFMPCPGLNNARKEISNNSKNPDFIMTFSKDNYFITNILTDFQNPDKIKKIIKSWLSDNPVDEKALCNDLSDSKAKKYNHCLCLLLNLAY